MSRLTGLLTSLIDDAAVFPPGNAPLADAVAAHHGYRDTPYEAVVGPLLIPASGVEQLRSLVDPNAITTIALVADTGLDGLIAARQAMQDDSWLEVVHVELPLPATDDPERALRQLLRELPFTVPAYVELPQSIDVVGPIAVLAEDGVERAKFRCGPDSVPTSHALAQFIHTCAGSRMPFKLTAGLHHALPFDTADGIKQHGFVNTLAATWAAIDGADVETTSSLLDTRNPDIVLGVLEAADVGRLRKIYRSFGSCSIVEPYDELLELQLNDEEL